MKTDDDLVARALDGLLSEEEDAAFSERLRQEPALARSLLDLARTEALLHEAAAVVPPDCDERVHRKGSLGGLLTMVAILLLSAVGLWTAFVPAPVATSPAQEGERLREAWPRLIEAWKSLETTPPDPLSDAYLKTMSQIHAAYQAAGWIDSTPEYPSAALKHLFKLRQAELGRGLSSPDSGGAADPPAAFATKQDLDMWRTYGLMSSSTGTLALSIRKLRELKEKGLDDEDNLQDAMSAVRASLKHLHLAADDTPVWLRRRLVALTRALILGEAYPEPARATEDDTRRIRAWIAELGGADIEGRDKAERELGRIGELAAPLLREALGHSDRELVERAKKILGMGHEPWKAATGGNRPAVGAGADTGVPLGAPGGFTPDPKRAK